MSDTRDWQPHVTVATVVERDGRFLLVDEIADGRRVINQPAGHLEPGETLLEGARRETLEETGWSVTIAGVIGTTLYTAANGVTYYRTAFFAEAAEEVPGTELDEGIIGPLWLSRTEMAERAGEMRSELVIRTVDQYLDGHRYPLSLIY